MPHGVPHREALPAAARYWERRARAFLHAYWSAVVAGGLYQAGLLDDVLAVLDLFEIGKALYELRYEIDNRPDWIGVPLAGLAALAAP
jgi:maltose alpha-D-glucosyltransferase/alpha-amylase